MGPCHSGSSNFKYGLDFKRRAYSIGAFYNSSNESLGLRFNIFNFDYSGLNKKFWQQKCILF